MALAFTSCKKTENDTKSYAFKSTTEKFVEVNQNGEFERMYIDEGYKTFFEEGDGIWIISIPGAGLSNASRYVLNADGYLDPIDEGSQVAPDLGEAEGAAYYAFYPGLQTDEAAISINTLTNVARFRIKPTLTYRPAINGAAQMPEKAVYMAAKEETRYFTDCLFNFKNIMGALSLRLYSTEGAKVTSIAVQDKKFNLAGDVLLNVSYVYPSYLSELFRNYNEADAAYMAELAEYLGPDQLNYSVEGDIRNTIVLDCGEGVQLGANAEEATRFLIPLRPLALKQGCKITITYDNGLSDEIDSDLNNTIAPNVIRNIYPINVDNL